MKREKREGAHKTPTIKIKTDIETWVFIGLAPSTEG